MAQFEFKITIGSDGHPEVVEGVVAATLDLNGIEGFIIVAGVEYWRDQRRPCYVVTWEQKAPRMIGLAHVRRIGEDIGKLLNARFVCAQANEVQFAEIV